MKLWFKKKVDVSVKYNLQTLFRMGELDVFGVFVKKRMEKINTFLHNNLKFKPHSNKAVHNILQKMG